MNDNNEMFDLLTKMYSEVQEMKTGINGRFDGLENKFDRLESRFDNLENTVNKTNIIIENDIKPRIESLFDGYKQNTEAINLLTDKVDDLQADVNNLTIKTIKNENNIIHFTRKIRDEDYKKNEQ
jgi:predicted nuclease with TOPRIM domain